MTIIFVIHELSKHAADTHMPKKQDAHRMSIPHIHAIGSARKKASKSIRMRQSHMMKQEPRDRTRSVNVGQIDSNNAKEDSFKFESDEDSVNLSQESDEDHILLDIKNSQHEVVISPKDVFRVPLLYLMPDSRVEI